MLSGASQKKLIAYWKETAADSYATMEYLYKGKLYADALFFGHLALEKALKGLVVRHTKETAKYTHNLTYLSENSGERFEEKDLKVLDLVNEFNILGRYPDWKIEFHKKCTKTFTDTHLSEIKRVYKILCQRFDAKKE